MTVLATSPVAEPDRLALVADDWTPLHRAAANRFRDACAVEARAHDGRVDPNGVRERLLVNGVLDIDPRQFSALWSTACAAGGYLVKTDELVPITGPGSKHNGGKSVRVRRWVGAAPQTPAAGADLGKAKPAAGTHSPGGGVAAAPRLPVSTSPGGCDRSTWSHVAAPVSPPPATGAVRFPAGRRGTARRYGPHDPAGEPRTVTVLGAGKWPVEFEEPVPVVLIEQRRLINEWAAG